MCSSILLGHETLSVSVNKNKTSFRRDGTQNTHQKQLKIIKINKESSERRPKNNHISRIFGGSCEGELGVKTNFGAKAEKKLEIDDNNLDRASLVK